MVPFNLIGITKFRTPEFLANIRIYDNEFFIVIKNDEPFLIGFPPIVLDRVVLETGFTETVKVTKRQVQRGETFGKEKPEIGKIYLLTEKGVPDFAFVTFMPFKTYPAVAGIFAQWKIFPDRLWEYYKPFIPPAEAKRLIAERKQETKKPLRSVRAVAF